jgi:myosin V
MSGQRPKRKGRSRPSITTRSMSMTGYTDQHEGLPVWISDANEAWIPGIISKVNRDNNIIQLSIPSRGNKELTIHASTAAYNKAGGQFEASREGDASSRVSTKTIGATSFRGNSGKKNVETRQLLPRSIAHAGKNMYDDMDDMPDLNEAAVLENIRHRFHIDLIYTRTGPILIAMNPFKWLQIYGEGTIQQYHQCNEVNKLPPHCFGIGEQSYRAMKSGKNSQSLIICGESGAGKTETTKLILRYLSSIASSGNVEVSTKIMQSNPLMEAFGNAKTLRNNNSSRFGKFISVAFDHHSCHVVGATITNYLLEKSRCVSLPSRERNFHIFYQLCAGASNEQRKKWKITNPREFYYLNQSSCLEVDGMNDGNEFVETISALKTLNFSNEDQNNLLSIIAGILHLGNIQFDCNSKDKATININSIVSLNTCAELLGIRGVGTLTGGEILGNALTSKIYYSPREDPIEVQLNIDESSSSRDAFAKGIYHRLFDWLIVHIDMSLNDQTESQAKGHMGGHQKLFIGILDIYGFESLTINGFEQLFINYANEKLQNLFNALIFQMEQDVYADEGIEWNPTDFPDNQVCLNLIEKRPKGK